MIKAKHGVKYIAISHVWSGGLGNPLATTMPLCQLKRLRDQLQLSQKVQAQTRRFYRRDSQARCDSRLSKWIVHELQIAKAPICFWMDTLCIPVAIEHVALRMKAIHSMGRIYARAESVLALDPELQKLSSASVDDMQLNARIMLCLDDTMLDFARSSPCKDVHDCT